MTIPFPPSAGAGNVDPVPWAREVYNNVAWAARWSQEIADDSDINLAKLLQLAFYQCRLLGQYLSNPPDGGASALEAQFRAGGIEWQSRADMMQDMATLLTTVNAFYAHVRDQMSERAMYEHRLDETGRKTDVAVVLPKPHPVEAEVAKIRALFS